MKKIPLTQNRYALVDNQDYGWLSQWHLPEGYKSKRLCMDMDVLLRKGWRVEKDARWSGEAAGGAIVGVNLMSALD